MIPHPVLFLKRFFFSCYSKYNVDKSIFKSIIASIDPGSASFLLIQLFIHSSGCCRHHNLMSNIMIRGLLCWPLLYGRWGWRFIQSHIHWICYHLCSSGCDSISTTAIVHLFHWEKTFSTAIILHLICGLSYFFVSYYSAREIDEAILGWILIITWGRTLSLRTF